MVSFDAIRLFTKVPLDEAMEAIVDKLTRDKTLYERTTLSINEICHMTNLCLRMTYFQFKDNYYKQLKGAAVGSPLPGCC